MRSACFVAEPPPVRETAHEEGAAPEDGPWHEEAVLVPTGEHREVLRVVLAQRKTLKRQHFSDDCVYF